MKVKIENGKIYVNSEYNKAFLLYTYGEAVLRIVADQEQDLHSIPKITQY